MAQYRAIHTKITQSFDFNEMPDDFTRLMWVLLPLGLDKEGRGIFNTSWIRSKLFPLREDVTAKRISDAFDWMIARGMIVCYEVEGRQYFWVPTFKSYQRTDKEAGSVLPSPELVQSNSGTTPELLRSNSCLKESKVNEIKEKEIKSSAAAGFSDSRPVIETNYLQVWYDATGMTGMPKGDEPMVIAAMDDMRPKFKSDAELAEYLKPYWEWWISRKTKDNRDYPRHNCAWLYDFAFTGQPLPKPKVTPPTPEVMLRVSDPDCEKCHGAGWYKGDIGGKTRRVECDCVGNKLQELTKKMEVDA